MNVLRNLIKVCINKQKCIRTHIYVLCILIDQISFAQTHLCIHAFMHIQQHTVRITTTVTNTNLNHSQLIKSNILYQVYMKSYLSLFPPLISHLPLFSSLLYICVLVDAFVHLNEDETYGVVDSVMMVMVLLLFSIIVLIINIVFIVDFQNVLHTIFGIKYTLSSIKTSTHCVHNRKEMLRNHFFQLIETG